MLDYYFLLPTVVEMIVQKHEYKPLTLDGARLDIRPMRPVTDSADFERIDDADPSRVVAFRLPVTVCTTDLKIYFEGSQCLVSRVAYACRPGFALVEFENPYGESTSVNLFCFSDMTCFPSY